MVQQGGILWKRARVYLSHILCRVFTLNVRRHLCFYFFPTVRAWFLFTFSRYMVDVPCEITLPSRLAPAFGFPTPPTALVGPPVLHLSSLGGINSLKTRTKGCRGHLNLNQSPFICYPTLICTKFCKSICLSKASSTSW